MGNTNFLKNLMGINNFRKILKFNKIYLQTLYNVLKYKYKEGNKN